MRKLLYFGVIALVFLFAYGVAVQSLLYPNSQERWWHILYRVFSRPYLSIFEAFDLDELAGVYRVFVLMYRVSVYPSYCTSVSILKQLAFYLFIMKFVQLGTQIKTQCKKRKYTKIHKKYIMKYIKTIS